MEILKQATKLYQENLNNHPEVISYIKNRGITQKTIEQFQVGFCSDNIGYNTLSKFYPDIELISSGIFKKFNNDGFEYINDSFNHRITFPIVVNNEIKHMTSRLFPGYKSRIKHLHQAGRIPYPINFDVLSDSTYVFIVEGPFDCMTLQQNGIASIGLLGANRMSQEIISSIIRHKVYIAFDSEPKQYGKKAAISISKKITSFDIFPYIVKLPYEKEKVDINSFFMNNSVDDFRKIVQCATIFNEKTQPKTIPNKTYKNDISIVEIISRYIEIEGTPNRYKARCPFHEDDSPSLVIYPDTNTFFCFGCGAYGNPITFIKKIEEQNGKKISNKQAYEQCVKK